MNFVLPWDLKGLRLPSSRKEHLLIEHTVFFVLQHGDQSEVRLRMDPQASQKIPFIDINHELHPYYQWLKSTKACLEERAPHLLPEGWSFWRKARTTEKKKKESVASLDGLLGHYDEPADTPAETSSDLVEPLTQAKAIADLNSLLGFNDVPSMTKKDKVKSDFAAAVTSPPAPSGLVARNSSPSGSMCAASSSSLSRASSSTSPCKYDTSLYDAAVTSPPVSSDDAARIEQQRQRQQRFSLRKHLLHDRHSSDLPNIEDTAASPSTSEVNSPTQRSTKSVSEMPMTETGEEKKDKNAKKRIEAATSPSAKKNKPNTVFEAARTDKETKEPVDTTEADNLLHSLLEYAENADIDEAVLADANLNKSKRSKSSSRSKSEDSTQRKAKKSASLATKSTPSVASTNDGTGSKTEKKERCAKQEPSNVLLALEAYSDEKSSTPWPKPGKLMPDRIALILDIGVLLLRQPLSIVKLARKVAWKEFSFLTGDEGAYFRQVVDVCITKIENDEHSGIDERPIPNRLIGFFGKLAMERQSALEKNALALQPAGKVSVLADEKQRLKEERRLSDEKQRLKEEQRLSDEKQRLKEERRLRALQLLKEKEKALKLHTFRDSHHGSKIKKPLNTDACNGN